MTKYILSGVCLFSVLLSQGFVGAESMDLLDTAISPSKEAGQVIDIGNNASAVGNNVFKKSVDIFTGKVTEPLYIRITKMILRMTLILGVSAGIFIGIRYVFAQGDDGTEKKLIGYLVNIIYGILLALSALVIVEVVQSITKSSITF